MKKVIFTLSMISWMSIVSAQELTVTYQATYNTASPQLFADAGLPEEMRRNLATAYKNVVMTYQLIFKGGESEFRLVPSEGKQEITFMGQTIDVNAAALAQAQNYTYKNHIDGIILDKTQAFGKNFIVIDSIQTTPFSVVEGEKTEILGFECLKAVSYNGKTIAWYSPHIPIKNEPISSGLDGLILQFDNGQQIFTAVEILDTINKEIVRPAEEESAITKKEFTELVNKRIEMLKRN